METRDHTFSIVSQEMQFRQKSLDFSIPKIFPPKVV